MEEIRKQELGTYNHYGENHEGKPTNTYKTIVWNIE